MQNRNKRKQKFSSLNNETTLFWESAEKSTATGQDTRQDDAKQVAGCTSCSDTFLVLNENGFF